MINRAIIAAAGLGTRMFPVTKVVEKSMLPLRTKPAIDYIVKECIDAGLDEIAIVVKSGDAQIRDYFGPDDALVETLSQKGWQAKASALDAISRPKHLRFIEQSLDGTYGTAVPILLCRDFVGTEPFVFVSGDDLLLHQGGKSSLRSLLKAAESVGTAILGHPVPASTSLDRYGVLETAQAGGATVLKGILEKVGGLTFERPLINVSRYVFDSTFVELLARVEVHESSGEHRLTDGLTELLNSPSASVAVVESVGEYFDLGSPDGFLAANAHLARGMDENRARC